MVGRRAGAGQPGFPGVRQHAVVSAARDDEGTVVELAAPVGRVVSLVPSLTEAVATTGRHLLVGATDWCRCPPDLDVVRVRGTKNPDLTTVISLEPDLVLTNFEENRPADIAALRSAGVPVWVTVIRTVPDALTSLQRMLTACGLARPGWLADAALVWAGPSGGPGGRRCRALVPIWRRPWMVLGRDTFAGDLLARIGVDNVYADAVDRYPRIALADAMGRRPDVVVLPSEPYAFGPADLGAFAGWSAPTAFVDGRLLTWYGPSLAAARQILAEAVWSVV